MANAHEYRFIMVMKSGATHIRALVSSMDFSDDNNVTEMIERLFARKNSTDGPFFAQACVWERDVKHVDIMKIEHIRRFPFTDEGLKK